MQLIILVDKCFAFEHIFTECAWRDWMNRDNPGASGDWEVNM